MMLHPLAIQQRYRQTDATERRAHGPTDWRTDPLSRFACNRIKLLLPDLHQLLCLHALRFFVVIFSAKLLVSYVVHSCLLSISSLHSSILCQNVQQPGFTVRMAFFDDGNCKMKTLCTTSFLEFVYSRLLLSRECEIKEQSSKKRKRASFAELTASGS